MEDDYIVQHIVIRSDLKFTKGALIANGAHASVAAIYTSIDRDYTK